MSNSMDHQELLRHIRLHELNIIMPYLPPQAKILEIGAGPGWQAGLLKEHGFDVAAIDIPESKHLNAAAFPIILYDGRNIPFPDETFDVVFSSNTLEHIFDIGAFLRETRRVLKPGALSIHVVPSGGWRFWTNVTHLLLPFKRRITMALSASLPACAKESNVPALIIKAPRKGRLSYLLPAAHGRRGDFITEIYYFSKKYWSRQFEKTGYKIISIIPNRLFYTGHALLDPILSIDRRRALSRILGSSCNIYILQNGQQFLSKNIRLHDF